MWCFRAPEFSSRGSSMREEAIMNGGGKSGLRRIVGGPADFEGPVRYRALLFCKTAQENAPVMVASASYADEPLTPRGSDVEFTIIGGIRPLSFVLALPEDQDIELYEKDAAGHANLLLQFRLTAANPLVIKTIRGVD